MRGQGQQGGTDQGFEALVSPVEEVGAEKTLDGDYCVGLEFQYYLLEIFIKKRKMNIFCFLVCWEDIG